MQKNCAYCGSPFSFQRNTKKYCSDNCKQMAYFSRNGFTLANDSISKSVYIDFHAKSTESDTVKGVKYGAHNGLNNGKSNEGNTISEYKLEKVMAYSKCLIRNLLHLSEHQHVERDTFLEFIATWSQFVRWRSFKSSELHFPHYSLMLELETKLNGLAKAHKQSDLIKINLSQELGDQLNGIMEQMEFLRTIKFHEIRF